MTKTGLHEFTPKHPSVDRLFSVRFAQAYAPATTAQRACVLGGRLACEHYWNTLHRRICLPLTSGSMCIVAPAPHFWTATGETLVINLSCSTGPPRPIWVGQVYAIFSCKTIVDRGYASHSHCHRRCRGFQYRKSHKDCHRDGGAHDDWRRHSPNPECGHMRGGHDGGAPPSRRRIRRRGR